MNMEIFTLAKGERVTRPGIYAGIPLDDYHRGDICDGPSISSSGLRTIFHDSPAEFWVHSRLNPLRVEESDKKHYTLGRAAHHLLLGEEAFSTQFIIRPTKWKDWRKDDAQEWRDQQIKKGFTVLVPDQIEQIRGMAGLLPWQKGLRDWGLANNDLVCDGLLDGEIELSMFWKDKETGIWLKARPDAIPNASGDFADLKTTQSTKTEAIEKAIRDYGYNQQGALISEGAHVLLGYENTSFTLAWVEVDPPHIVRPEPIRDVDLARGELQNRAALRLFADCWERGQWPGPGHESAGVTVGLPPWDQKKIDDKLQLMGIK